MSPDVVVSDLVRTRLGQPVQNALYELVQAIPQNRVAFGVFGPVNTRLRMTLNDPTWNVVREEVVP